MNTAMVRTASGVLVAWLIVSSHLGCTEQRDGGPCTYANFVGTATVKELKPHEEGADARGYWVVFDTTFADEKGMPSFYKHEGRAVLIKNPAGNTDLAWLSEHGIDVESKLEVNVAIIKSGTCTPVIFKFPTLPPDSVQD